MAAADLHLLLLGAPLSGRSSVGNAVLGEDVFELSHDMDSETSGCCAKQRCVHGRSISVTDTAGLDGGASEMEQLLQAVASRSPRGVDAVLLTVRSDVRFHKNDWEIFRTAETVFGSEFFSFCIVVFTHGDRFKGDQQKFEQWLQTMRSKSPEMQQLLTSCGGRFVLMDNNGNRSSWQRQQQVSDLLRAVDDLRKAVGKKLTNETFERLAQRVSGGRGDSSELESRVLLLEDQVKQIFSQVSSLKLQLDSSTQQKQASSSGSEKPNVSSSGAATNAAGAASGQQPSYQLRPHQPSYQLRPQQPGGVSARSKETGSSAEINVALVGKTGCGKSSLGNALLGDTVFVANHSAVSSTSKCSLATAPNRFGKRIRVVDTPGTVDNIDQRAAMQQLVKAIRYCAEGFDSFLLVVRWGRFTDEEQKAIEDVQKAFGDDFYHFSIVVFTHCDNFDTETELRKGVASDRKQNKGLDRLLRMCSNRYLMIDNGPRRDKQLQQQQLQQIVDKIQAVRDGNGSRYSNPLFEQAQRQRAEQERLEMAAKAREEELLRRGATKQEVEQMKKQHERDMKELQDKHDREMHAGNGRWKCPLM